MNRLLLIGSLAALLVGTTGCLHHNTRSNGCKTCSTGNSSTGVVPIGNCGNGTATVARRAPMPTETVASVWAMAATVEACRAVCVARVVADLVAFRGGWAGSRAGTTTAPTCNQVSWDITQVTH